MKPYDFDSETQGIFNELFNKIQYADWKKWLNVNSIEEYEELILNVSELESIPDIYDQIHKIQTDSKKFAVNLNEFLKDYEKNNPALLCHTSGTTTGEISSLKWFHMTRKNVENLWAPGMNAIFESSGLNSRSSVIIFVPSRLKFDGINKLENVNYVSLYSAEFSQRVMLSIINPENYLLYEYKDSKNLKVLTQILSMDKIKAISAPAATILGWADLDKFKIGIKKSLEMLKNEKNPAVKEILVDIQKRGFDSTIKSLQEKLSNKLSKATLIFSISSLNEKSWNLIRKFMKWENGKEKFTNLYVASEIGPFAASIHLNDFTLARQNKMIIFPLTLPVIKYKGKFELVTRTKFNYGELFVSRMNNGEPLVNISTSDIIFIESNDHFPIMGGKILRNNFILKYPIRFSKKIEISPKSSISTGHYFNFERFELIEPQLLLNCLTTKCNHQFDSFLLKSDDESNSWTLFLEKDEPPNCSTYENIKQFIHKCSINKEFKDSILDGTIQIELLEDKPINFMALRQEMLEKVHKGQVPKGILKKWPLYVVESKN